MKSKKTTRRALLTSMLSLLICVSMLVGSTFAWFTDSVTSQNNIIKSGNLDIEMEYSMNLQTWNDISGAADVFVAPAGATKGLWEPGHTEVAYLRITNAGTLSLKYRLQVAPYTETVGESADGKDIKLSEILKFAATEPSATAPTAYTRETAQAAALAAANSVKLTDYTTGVVTMAPGEVQYIALVVYMPEEVGNEANYRGTDIPKIEFALNLQATQVEAESDSFDNTYDKDSEFGVDVGTLAELEAALEVGGIINLTADITTEKGVNVTKDTVLNLNGHTLTATGERACGITCEGTGIDLVIENGKLVAESTNGQVTGTGTSTGASSSVVFDSTGTLTMTDVEIQGSVRGGHRAVEVSSGKAYLTNVDITSHYGSGVNAGSGANVELTDCDITVNGMYTAPYNSVCFSVMYGGRLTIHSGNYKLINDNVYTTGDTHGGWVGIVMNSGGTITTLGGTYTNVPAVGFVPAYERAIIEGENASPAVATINLLGGTFIPQKDKVYSGYGIGESPTYPVFNGVLTDNGDGTWTASPSAGTEIWAGVAYETSEDGKDATIFALSEGTTVRGMIEGDTDIETLEVGEGVTVFGNRTARRCYGLTTVTLPESLTEIGPAAFQSCTSLSSVNIPASVTVIGEGAFAECSSLTSITIPNGVTRIEKDSFRATGLTEVTLPASVTYIGSNAFRDCDSLTTVYIMAESFTIEANAFNNVANPYPTTTIYVQNAEMQTYLQGVFQDNSSAAHITVEVMVP